MFLQQSVSTCPLFLRLHCLDERTIGSLQNVEIDDLRDELNREQKNVDIDQADSNPLLISHCLLVFYPNYFSHANKATKGITVYSSIVIYEWTPVGECYRYLKTFADFRILDPMWLMCSYDDSIVHGLTKIGFKE